MFVINAARAVLRGADINAVAWSGELMAVNVGLDIGTSAVRAALVNTGKGTPTLQRYGEVALPPGAVVGGEIVDEELVQGAISRLWKTAKLPKKRVVLGIANQRVIVRRVDLPYMAESELSESLAFQAQEYIPIPIDDAILDFIPLEEFTTPEGEPMLSVLVVAAQKQMASDVLRVVQAVGIKPMAVDLQAFALVRVLFGGDLNLDAAPQVIVNIGAGLTQVVIVKGGSVRFLRIVSLAGEDFSRVLIEGMGMDAAQAEQTKRRVGVAIEGTPSGGDGDEKARLLLTRQADALIDEIRGSVDYYLSQAADTGIQQLYVAGNAARLPHLANRLGRSLNVEVSPIRMLEGDRLSVGKIGLSEAELAQAQPVLPVPVGLALWGEV